MNSFTPSFPAAAARSHRLGQNVHPRAQAGVVLIIALVMLVVISLLATLSIRNAISTESVSGNVRTTQLASQAAEIALRYCEEATIQINAGTGTLTVTPAILNYISPARWTDPATNWDGAGSAASVFIVPTASVNQAGGTVTFNRLPECMVERVPVVTASGVISNTSTYTITARGFGPEVATVDAARSRPTGSEVWMQSTIELE